MTDGGTRPDPSHPTGAFQRRRRNERRRRALAIWMCVLAVGGLGVALAMRMSVRPRSSPTSDSAAPPRVDIRGLDGPGLLGSVLLRPSGTPVTLKQLGGGRPILVNLWAQSCVPCVTEMPILEQAHRGEPGVAFIGVDVLDRVKLAQRMVERTGITYPWVQDEDGAFAADAKTSNIPTTLLFDATGAAVAVKVGAFDSVADVQRWIDGHLK